MAARVVSVRVFNAEVNRLLRGRGGPTVRHVTDIARRTTNIAKATSPVDKGILRASLHTDVDVRQGEVIGRTTTNVEYAPYVTLGTGIYGPTGRVITPTNHRFLRFEVKGGPRPRRRGARVTSNVVYARFVRGTPPNPFMQEALKAASPYPVREFHVPSPGFTA